jgi:FkbM family methyltransferase
MTDLDLHSIAASPVHHIAGTIAECTIDRVPLRFFVRNANDHIQNYNLRGCFYEPDELKLIAQHVPQRSTIADIGSNIGNHALFFEKFLAAKSVILFEINPEAIEILKINQSLNACTTWDDQYLGYALAASNGRMKKMVYGENNLGATQFCDDPQGTFMSITGDSVLSSRRVDFIKIDVEGGEMAVLHGLSETIARWRPIVFAELRDQYLNEFNIWLRKSSYQVVEKFERYVGLPNYLVKPV